MSTAIENNISVPIVYWISSSKNLATSLCGPGVAFILKAPTSVNTILGFSGLNLKINV